MARYRKRPVSVEAVQWTGDAKCLSGRGEKWARDALTPQAGTRCAIFCGPTGRTRVWPGEWVVRLENGALYSCSDADFTRTYEADAE